MKNNFKFFSIVLVLLLASSIVLTGCMYAIAAENGDAKVYDMGSQISANSNIIVDYDTPTSQTELQKKFSAMYDICEDGKTITVISKEYLSEFWYSNYEKEVIHSLTTEEVYFIIQDSIRIYMEHDKVILAEFGSVSSDKQVAERFPYLAGAELSSRSVKSSLDREKIENDIHTIIMYRLRALSSPKAFFTGADAISFVGRDTSAYNSMYPESVFYIPGYSANTDRDYILSIMGGNSNFTDPEKFTDLFEVSVEGGINIRFSSVVNGSTTEVYPTEDMFKYAFGTPEDSNESNDKNANETPEIFKPHFVLDIANGRFRIVMTLEVSSSISGSYVQKGDKLVLYPYDNKAPEGYVYVFQYQEGVGYNYIKGESNPIPGFDFEDETVFSLNDNLLKPTEK